MKINSTNGSYTTSAAASSTLRTFTVYGGIASGSARLSARLSDNSVGAVQSAEITAPTGSITGVTWALDYGSLQPGITVIATVTITASTSSSSYAILAATTVR